MPTEKVLEGRVAVVTGGASGIGKAVCLTLAAQGAQVAIADVNLEGAQKVAQAAEALGTKALAVQTDVSQWSQVSSMVDKTVEAFGAVDILVNDAGVVSSRAVGGSIFKFTEEDWDRVFNINLKGQALCCRAVLPYMIRQKRGAVVNISSSSGFRPSPDNLPYALSKLAIVHLSRSLAEGFGKDNIRVNTIVPSLTDTPMTRWNWPTDADLQRVATESVIKNPMQAVLQPQDIADAVLFLVSDASRHITGQALHVNGGHYMP